MFKFSITFLPVLMLSIQVCTAFAVDTDINFVPDVKVQFDALAHRPDALGFNLHDSPDPNQSDHYQGIVRAQGSNGTPLFFVTRSGGGGPGNLLLVRMGSRDAHAERMRSNRLQRFVKTDDSPPSGYDYAVKTYDFDGDNLPPYDHAGAMQLVGDVLAVPLEEPLEDDRPHNLIVFLDVSVTLQENNPQVPIFLGELNLDPYLPFPATAAVALAKTNKAKPTFLLLVTGKNNDFIWIFESSSLDFSATDFSWTQLDTWSEDEDESYLGHSWPSDLCSLPWPWGKEETWGKCDHPHQMLNFVREGSSGGDLYLIGTRYNGGAPAHPYLSSNYIDLYKVEWCNASRDTCQTGYGPGFGEFTLKFVQSENVSAKPTNAADSDGNVVNFAAAGGVYVSPTGELIIYGTEHANSGPVVDGVKTVRAGEYRHKQMVRPGSPTYRPTATIDGPLLVPEGSQIVLNGQGKAAISKAWMELFRDSSWKGMSIVLDFDDWGKENFDDFRKISFNNEGSSMRWFAPYTCTLRLNEKQFGHSKFPGKKTITVAGSGLVREAPHFTTLYDDSGNKGINDEASSMEFFWSCDDYYNQMIEMWWDLDDDDDYETLGETPVFSAMGMDGPDEVTVSLMAMHPTDGTNGTTKATILIENVAPHIEMFEIVDQNGQVIGVDTPVTLIGLDLDLSAAFTDPGIPDTHTATVDWGDGTVVSPVPVTGSVNTSHAYTAAGSYSVNLTVFDDDGDKGIKSQSIEVASAETVIWIVAGILDGLPPNRNITTAIGKLDGSDGALGKLEKGTLNAALEKIKQSLQYLEMATATNQSVELETARELLALSAKSIVIDAIEKAESMASKPGELRMLAAALVSVEEGDMILANGDYAGAVLEYQNAARSIQGIH